MNTISGERDLHLWLVKITIFSRKAFIVSKFVLYHYSKIVNVKNNSLILKILCIFKLKIEFLLDKIICKIIFMLDMKFVSFMMSSTNRLK